MIENFVLCSVAGATSEGVLANFFNSLLSKKTGSPGGPSVGGGSPGTGAGGGSSGLPPSAKKSGIVTRTFFFFYKTVLWRYNLHTVK